MKNCSFDQAERAPCLCPPRMETTWASTRALQMISPKPILPELAPWAASWAFQMASPGHLREQNHPASGRRRRSRLPRLYNTGRVGSGPPIGLWDSRLHLEKSPKPRPSLPYDFRLARNSENVSVGSLRLRWSICFQMALPCPSLIICCSSASAIISALVRCCKWYRRI